MTAITQTGNPSKLSQRYDKTVRNSGSEEILPFSVMQISGVNLVSQDEIYNVSRPSGTTKAKFLINGPQTIAGNGYGSATDTSPVVAAWADFVPPVAGQEWGPVAGSWSLSSNGKGFLILGGAEGDFFGTVRVAAIPPNATTGADFPLILVKNTTGFTLGSRTIVGIGDPVEQLPGLLPTQPVFFSTAPKAKKLFAITMAEANPNGIVDAAPLGIVACQLDFIDTNHVRCDPVDGNYSNLRSGASGRARIVWRERQGVSGPSSLGVQWAFVFIESGGGIGLKWGIVGNGTFITAAKGFYLQNIKPGSGPVYEYTPSPLDPVRFEGSQVLGEMTQSSVGANLWLTMSPTSSESRKGVIGITDEQGLTWVIAEFCKPWPEAQTTPS